MMLLQAASGNINITVLRYKQIKSQPGKKHYYIANDAVKYQIFQTLRQKRLRNHKPQPSFKPPFCRQSHNSWGEKILLTGHRGQSLPFYPVNTTEESDRAKARGTNEPRVMGAQSTVWSPRPNAELSPDRSLSRKHPTANTSRCLNISPHKRELFIIL